ncbi:unnamed protein product [Rhizoctonia solani]|uniref:Transmembrane protein n=1 Tax=Rhizoctonia solani TaxID=456999 RepID=A0A8H3CEE8_9AGAM|nr:unnamed protein product [Rhizoctonia solani]
MAVCKTRRICYWRSRRRVRNVGRISKYAHKRGYVGQPHICSSRDYIYTCSTAHDYLDLFNSAAAANIELELVSSSTAHKCHFVIYACATAVKFNSGTNPNEPDDTASQHTAVISTTDGSGRVITSVLIVTQSAQSVAVPATATSTADEEKKGLTPATTIGLAVTGSIAGLLVILLIVWKLTNKRFSDLDDTDDDAIKWPELHKDSAAMTPIPARPTPSARAETDTLGTDFDRQSAAHSTADLQYPPYSDDPGYGARPAYYDPYGGAAGATKLYPSPPGSHDGDHKNWGGPAEGQYYDPARVASPGPNAIARGMSPGPGMAYDARAASPAPPNMAYADQVGRTGSPGPAGYGYAGGYAQPDPYSGRHSPGPNMAYGQPEVDPYGRRSPGPGMAYNGSAGRVASPGPGAGYR